MQGFLDDQSLDEVNASTQQQPPLVTCQMIGAAVAQHAATSGLPLHVHRVQVRRHVDVSLFLFYVSFVLVIFFLSLFVHSANKQKSSSIFMPARSHLCISAFIHTCMHTYVM